jgi:dTDP-L-rhamnose 4-epimerase
VLVTGGAGFIGSHVVEQLADAGHEVVVLDALHPAAHRTRPADLDPRVEHRWGSVADAGVARQAVDGCETVCHLAAMVGLGVDFSDAVDYAHHNDVGTATLLRALHESGRVRRLVLASSMVVYGEGRYRCAEHGLVEPGPRDPAALASGRYDPTCPRCGRGLDPVEVPETAPLRPRNVYAATKLHQEHLATAFGIEHPEVAIAALRYHNVYGPRMPRDTPYAGVASLFRSALERGEAPVVFEDGAQLRDFVHVRDVAAATVSAALAPPDVTGPFNIASGTPRSVGAMARELASAFGPGAPEPVVAGGARPGDVRHVFASPERARRELGFAAAVTFEAGVREFAGAPLRT